MPRIAVLPLVPLVALLGVGVGVSRAATDSSWIARAWQSEHGLPDNNVTGVSQTAEGYLVVSTHSGIVQFDGVRFNRVQLPLPGGRSPPLIRAHLLASNGQLWLALEGSMVIGIGSQGTNIFTSTDGLPNFRPLSIVEGKDGAIWLGYDDGSAYRIVRGQVARFTARDGLPGAGGCWMMRDVRGEIWFAKAGRIGRFRDERFHTLLTLEDRGAAIGAARDGGVWIVAGQEILKYADGGELRRAGRFAGAQPPTQARTLLEHPAGTLWIGTAGSGVHLFDGTNIARVETSHGSIQTLASDRENSLWVGTTGGGLNRLRPKILHLEGADTGLPFERVRSVCRDDSGRIWAAGENGALAWRTGESWQVVSTNEGWSGARATCVANGAGRVWIGTHRSGLYSYANGAFTQLTRREGLGGDIVRSLLADRYNNLWIGLESSSCLQRFDGQRLVTLHQPPNSRYVRALTQDSAGRIWAGTADGFLLRVEGDALVDETGRTLDTPKPIRCLLATPDGALWIGFANAGLGRLSDSGFVRLGIEQGLPDSYICGIQLDASGSMWCAADHGIFQIARRELEDAIATGSRVAPILYGRDQGLPNLQGSYGYAPGTLRGPDGTVWFTTHTGLAVVHPDRVQPHLAPPPLRLERALVDSQTVPLPDAGAPLRLRPGTRRLTLDFAALSFMAPDHVRVRHRLENWDDDWTETTGSRTVTYTRLPAGDYRFWLMARNEGGPWSQAVSLNVCVQPFFWETWWFWGALSAVTVAGVGFSVRSLERRKIRARMAWLERENIVERERARIARDIHDELGASLAQIALLADIAGSDSAGPPAAQGAASKIAARARAAVSALDEIVWAANPRNDNLPRLADYLCQMLDDCLESTLVRCRKDVPTGLPPLPVRAELRHNLALAVKEAFSNALKHSQAATLRLRLRWEDPQLLVSVEDDGKGFAPGAAQGTGNGLRNQVTRMEQVGGTVSVHSSPGNGAKILFKVRLTASPAGVKPAADLSGQKSYL